MNNDYINKYATAHIKKGEARALKAGGAWIYDNEIESVSGDYNDGDILQVLDFDGYKLGYGFINSNSKIRIRMLSRYQKDAPDENFIRSRVQDALNYRQAVMPEVFDLEERDSYSNSCRLIFGEADWLPGLVVDLYRDVLVVESLSLGIDKLKSIIIDEIIQYLSTININIVAVYERSDAPVRRKEGMEPYKGLIWSTETYDKPIIEYLSRIPVSENGVKYKVDVINGQKTGFFLDQKYNRLAMQKIVQGVIKSKLSSNEAHFEMKVLDCFTHMGTFALNCSLAIKAALGDEDKLSHVSVTGLDISDYAVSQATNNAATNELSQTASFRTANVLDELPKLYEAGQQYDVLILDPPAFTKSREATKNAIKGYREINMKGLKLVKNGGYFATCSCSHFMTEDLFIQTVAQAAKAVHRRVRQIEFNTQAPDHPILWSADESYYLKFLIFQVCDEK